MRYLTFIFVLVALLALIAGGGCERKVTNEIVDNTTDFTGADQCMTCHGDNDLTMSAAQAQWATSKHGIGETAIINSLAGDRSCERCHTGEGFLAYLAGTGTDSSHYSGIGCFTCHAPHTTGTLALRTVAPYTLENGVVFDHGMGNLCANCHHSRRNVNTYVADSVKLSSRFGPHHSNPGDMLEGTGGYEYADYTYSNSAHSNVAADGCVDCHMSPSLGNAVGGHTWRMAEETFEGEEQNLSGCNKPLCHAGEVEDLNFEYAQDSTNTYFDALGEALLAADLLDSTYAPKADKIVKHRDSTGAVYNYMFIKEDRSEGIHNTEYALGLLKSALNYITTGDPNGAGAPPATQLAALKKD